MVKVFRASKVKAMCTLARWQHRLLAIASQDLLRIRRSSGASSKSAVSIANSAFLLCIDDDSNYSSIHPHLYSLSVESINPYPTQSVGQEELLVKRCITRYAINK